MLRQDESILDNPPWLAAAGREILRIGYTDQIIGKIIPDLLRIIVGTSQLELVPKAAIYLNDATTRKASLAGFYNVDWTLLETSMDLCFETFKGPDSGTGLERIFIPLTGDAADFIGTLVLYTSNSGHYAHISALSALAVDIATVIRSKVQQEDTQSATINIMVPQKEPQDDCSLLRDNVVELLRTAIDNFPGGICVLNDDLTVMMTNNRLYKVMNLPVSRFQPGCNFADILRYYAHRGDYGPGNVEELAQERIRHALLFVDHVFDRETASGHVLEVRTTPLAGGGCVVTYLDVTARKKAERELMHHRDRLEALVSERTGEIERQARKLRRLLVHERKVSEQTRQFVAMASHEFRTPLAIIDGAAQRLIRTKSKITPEFVGDKVERIRGSVSRMVELMEGILAFGRLEHGLLDIKPEPISIGELIRLCVADQKKVNPGHSIKLDIENLPEKIKADRSAMQQVFTNLLSNAIKYAPKSPDIFVRGWCENGHVYVSVRDQGLGIDADDIPKLFQRYFRARTSIGIAGTGIGLNLVQQIVELHGGTISVKSEKDQGSVFTIDLPRGVQELSNHIIPETETA